MNQWIMGHCLGFRLANINTNITARGLMGVASVNSISIITPHIMSTFPAIHICATHHRMREEAAQANIAKWEMRERENRSGDEDSVSTEETPSGTGHQRGLSVPSFNRAQVRCRRRPDASVELAQHRQAQLLGRLVLDRVGEFGDVAKRHRPLGPHIRTDRSNLSCDLGCRRTLSLSASLKAMCIWVLEAVM